MLITDQFLLARNGQRNEIIIKTSRLLLELNSFLANTPIIYPLKTPETKGFLVLLGGIKWEDWLEID